MSLLGTMDREKIQELQFVLVDIWLFGPSNPAETRIYKAIKSGEWRNYDLEQRWQIYTAEEYDVYKHTQ